MEDMFAQKMLPPLTPDGMEALKTPQIEPTVDTASPFASVPNAYGEKTVTAQDTADAEHARQLNHSDYEYSQYFSDVAGADWATSQWVVNSFGDEGGDPSWDLTKAHEERWKKELPEYMWPRIADEGITSEKQFDSAVARLKNEDVITSRLANVSGWGAAGRFGLSMLDPSEIIAGIGTEIITAGIASPMLAAKWGMKLKNAKMLMGAVSNAGLGVGFNAARDKGDMSAADYGWSLGFDLMLGGVMGRLDPTHAGIGQKQIEDIKLPKSEQGLRIDQAWEDFGKLQDRAHGVTLDTVGDGPFSARPGKVDPASLPPAPIVDAPRVTVPPMSSVGATMTDTPDIRPGVTTSPVLSQADAPQSHALDKGRISVLGRSMASESPMERLIMPHLGEDAVGRADGSVTPISTSEWARQRHTAAEAAWRQGLLPAWKEWQAKQDYSGVSGAVRKVWSSNKDFSRFSEQVYDFIEDTRPDAAHFYEPEVVKAGNSARGVLKSYAEEYHNPGLADGTVMRSVAGAERLKPDPYYFPKIADREAIDELTGRFGTNQIKAVVRAAVEKAMTEQGYDINAELMDRVAEGWFTNISKAGYGQEDGLAQILAGRSRSRMHEVLGAAGIEEDVVNQIVQAMDAKDASTPRLKNRAPIDYRHTMKVQDLKTNEWVDFRPLDFFSKDIDHVMMSYSRHAAGDVAFGRLRIKDPTTTAGHMIDGITSRAEFEQKVLKPLADDWQRKGGGEEGRLKAKEAQERADYLYKATMGLPLHDMNPKHATWLRRVRDYNFLRLMNNMGITQSIELGRQFSMVGLKASLEQMPSLKRIIDPNTGSLVLKSKMAREMEMWGVTENDYWIGEAKYNFQEDKVGTASSKAGAAGHTYDKMVERGKEIMAYTSMQRPVHSRQQQWAARAAVQWFADNSRDAKKFAKFKDRIADMGLDEADMKAIRSQIVKHAEARDPEFNKITAMNFEKWDPEIRAKFLSSVRRYTNRIIQVNEPGNLPMFFSHPVAQTFLQFRTFSIAAYDKSTLWHMKHHDQQSMMVALGDIIFGAATFALMTTIKAATRDDKDEYLAEQLDPAHLALMGFARGGISSVLPMLIDTGLMFTPMNPLFMGARAGSGSATDALGGSAPIDLINSVASTSKAVADSLWSGRELSQQELKGGQRIMPGSNFIPGTLLFDSMIRDRERMAPRQPQ